MSGTKVTTDPIGKENPIIEGTGVVTSDSLAAESLKQGGEFADGKAAVSGQQSKGSTAANTDTSGATTLPPAENVESRGDAGFGDPAFKDTLKNSGGDNEGAGFSAPGFADELKKSGGDSSSAGFGDPAFKDQLKSSGGDNSGAGFSAPGFADTLKNSGGDNSGAGFGAPGFAQSLQDQQGGTAPSYVNAGELRGDQKPKGEGLKEGGFDSNAKNASFNNEIGTKNDPGRLAEEKFARSDATAGADSAGTGPKQTEISGDNQYSALDAERAA